MSGENEELHYHTHYQLDRLMAQIVEHPRITARNKEHIIQFFELSRAQRLSNARLAKMLWVMRNLGDWIGPKDFETASRNDIVSLVNIINTRYPNFCTSLDYRSLLKKFYRQMFGTSGLAPEPVAWIRLGRSNRRVNPAYLLSEQEVLRLLQSQDAQNGNWARVRNKAMIAFLYETGVRVGELLNMRMADLAVGGTLWHVTVRGKTGQRTFPILPSIQYLKEYLDLHPRRGLPDAYLWCRQLNPDRRITYEQVTKTLRRAFKRAGVTKPANPHNFRKTACSRDAAFMSDQQLKKKFGWTPDSKELRTYAHVRLEDLENSMRDRYGLTREKQIEAEFVEKRCRFCGARNKPEQQFCLRCTRPLAASGMTEREQLGELASELLFSIAGEDEQLKDRLKQLLATKNFHV